MTYEYSEDNLIEQTAIDLFFNKLGWDILLAYNKEKLWRRSNLINSKVNQ
jgi:type I restriction enzyme R subunit